MTATTPAPKPGSVALITGGTGGFGRALATKLKALDVTVVLAVPRAPHSGSIRETSGKPRPVSLS